jgi:PAS domain S-box-containing protein
MGSLRVANERPPRRVRQREAEFHRLLDKIPAAAYTCDPSGLITYYNTRAVELWGRAPQLESALDRYCGSYRLYSSDGTPIAHDECWMALALRTGEEYTGREIVIERPDGSRVTALAHAHPLHDQFGRLQGGVNILVDTSERKAAEAALREARRCTEEFLATLAHELRNPLAPLSNAVEILGMKVPDSPENRSALSVIDRQVRQMTRLIDDLMDISRLTRNKLELKRQQVKLVDVVHAALETSQPLIESGGHQFTMQMPGGQILLEADPTRLAQVISNLLNNAAKFTPRGGHITLKVERTGEEAVLRVKDTGIGIPAGALPLIFELFAQADPSLERSHTGLGVGLTLVQRLVELHGGVVEAHSEGVNRGSEFVVRLPLAPRPAPAVAAPAQREASAACRPLRILVVDDNVDATSTLAALLDLSGHDVRTAHDGPQGLEELASFPADVVILDIGMPKMNGYTVATRIRAQRTEPQPLLIALTGWGQEEDRQRSRAAGFDHHMVKPVDPAALDRLLAMRERRTLH